MEQINICHPHKFPIFKTHCHKQYNQATQKRMSKKQMTLIYYYIPQDHDDEQTPNVFGIMVSKNNVRLQHLYDNFPLKGSYIFRFKVMYDNTIAWLDLPELDTKLPTFKDKIVVKATRISWESNQANPYGHYRFLKKEQTSSLPAQQAPVKKQAPQTPTQPKVQKVAQPQQQAGVKTQNTDLLSSHHDSNPNMINIPHDFDLLSTATTTQAKSATDAGMGDLLI